uniref:Uncharacterized protein n=1 Tax=Leviviridae sp. TaxID=2027243 RepID=A0A514D3X2_9VIRU|nr:MAG: hypothetical protein H3Bulk42324_000003 [Leviviridae sp.]
MSTVSIVVMMAILVGKALLPDPIWDEMLARLFTLFLQ